MREHYCKQKKKWRIIAGKVNKLIRVLCRRSLLKAPKIKLNNLHIASDKKQRLTLFPSWMHMARAKKPSLHINLLHFSPWQKTKKRPRALLPFEVASIPFDIMFSVCFLLFSLAASRILFFFCLICHQNHRRGGHEQQTKESKANESFVTTRAPRDSNARHFLNT